MKNDTTELCTLKGHKSEKRGVLNGGMKLEASSGKKYEPGVARELIERW